MIKPCLNLLVMPDLLPWEISVLSPIEKCLASQFDIRRIEVGLHKPNSWTSMLGDGPCWVLSHQWKTALRILSVSPRSRVFVSVLSMEQSSPFLPNLFWKRLGTAVPANVTLVAHSSLSHRFLREIVRAEEHQIAFLPLPLVSSGPIEDSAREFTVGSFGRFIPESNLNYFLNVAHYVRRCAPGVRFSIVGAGPLGVHVAQMTKDLDLSDVVSISSEVFSPPDLLLYHPLQNQHFLPVLFAASHSVAVIANEIPGIEDFIQDGREGFLVSVNETRPMAELVLRLASDSVMRRALGDRLKRRAAEQFSVDALSSKYLGLIASPSSAGHLKAA